MTRTRSPISPRTVVQWFAVVLIVTITIATIGQIRDAQPYVAPDFVVEGTDTAAESLEFVTCERTLPDRPVVTEGQRPEPVGRVTSGEVVKCPDAFDGQAVVYIGEVIGDVLHRDGGAWVLMNDDAYALEVGPLDSHGEFQGYNSGLSVWLDGDLADLVDQPGGSTHRGDILRVRGIVHRTDPDDGGGLTIRAFEGRVLAPAVELDRPVNRPQAVVAGLLAVIAVAIVGYERVVAARR